MKTKVAANYPTITKLGIPIYLGAGTCLYVKCADINKVFDKKQRTKFSKCFGIQTGILDGDGLPALFASDVESVLVRMFTGKLTGSQLLFD